MKQEETVFFLNFSILFWLFPKSKETKDHFNKKENETPHYLSTNIPPFPPPPSLSIWFSKLHFFWRHFSVSSEWRGKFESQKRAHPFFPLMGKCTLSKRFFSPHRLIFCFIDQLFFRVFFFTSSSWSKDIFFFSPRLSVSFSMKKRPDAFFVVFFFFRRIREKEFAPSFPLHRKSKCKSPSMKQRMTPRAGERNPKSKELFASLPHLNETSHKNFESYILGQMI